MLPRKLQELWDGMEENRKITLGMVSGLSEAAFVRREEGEWSVSEILEHLVIAETGSSKLIRKATRETLTMLAGSDPRSVEFPHPFFGSMNLYEWPHRIIREHEHQHHPQIERILRSRGK